MNDYGQVAPHPVVAIDISDGAIRVNGELVDHDGRGDVHATAVHEVARRVAMPLNRPVRAIATDDEGATQLVVHPDGSASDVQTVTHQPGGVDEVATLEEMLSGPPAPEEPSRPSGPREVVDEIPRVVGDPAAVSPAPDTGRHAQPRTERPSFITVGRAVQPAERGWRGGLNQMGLRLNPGPGERAYRDDVAAVSRHWPGTRTVAVANQKGSASKTPTSLCLAACFARHGGAGVLAWDNNETEGTMRFRTEWSPHESTLLHLLPKVDQLLAPTAAVAELSNYVHHQPADKYDVLWSDTTIDGDHVVSDADVAAIHRVASRYYRMVVMDSGNSNRAPNWRAMIGQADALVVPCTNVEDTAEVGARLLETLANRDEHSAQLARNALVVVSQRTKHSQNMDRIVRDFQGLARRVVRIPYDPALETGVIRFSALDQATQRAWLAAAAALTEAL